jgi:Rrf2 family protein
LADYGETNPVSISEIADRQGISANYLEQLLPKLRKAGLIRSERGAQGGYQLAQPSGDISVGDILRALGENISLAECVTDSELKDINCRTGVAGEESRCKTQDACAAKFVWQRINDSINSAIDSIMLDELVQISRNSRSKGTNKI